MEEGYFPQIYLWGLKYGFMTAHSEIGCLFFMKKANEQLGSCWKLVRKEGIGGDRQALVGWSSISAACLTVQFWLMKLEEIKISFDAI